MQRKSQQDLAPPFVPQREVGDRQEEAELVALSGYDRELCGWARCDRGKSGTGCFKQADDKTLCVCVCVCCLEGMQTCSNRNASPRIQAFPDRNSWQKEIKRHGFGMGDKKGGSQQGL